MDCISGRKNQGRVTGDVRVNGHPQVLASAPCLHLRTPDEHITQSIFMAVDHGIVSACESLHLTFPAARAAHSSQRNAASMPACRLLMMKFCTTICFAQDFATFARVSGYVEQFDIHSPQATVKESLWFSARLRLTNDISNRELWAFIRQVRPLITAKGSSDPSATPTCDAFCIPTYPLVTK